ncbi:Myosin-like protein, partial [Globisporangium splendens]
MVRRAEELQDWICQVTEQVNDGEHLSVMLQDGQMLCMLANAIDPVANIKVNKLNTAFHSRANVKLFVDWCKANGLRDADIFQPDDLIDGNDFVAVVATLSILYDKFGGITYGDASESDGDNPLSDSESQTSSGSSHGAVSPQKKNSGNKLTAFMKGGFFGKKKSAKLASPPAHEGTPPMSPASPPPESPQFGGGSGTPPRSPQAASSPLGFESSPRQQTRTLSGGGNNSRLNAFLTQVPASREAPLEHVSKPAGPPKRTPSRKENKPANIPPSPVTPPRELKKNVLGMPQPGSAANDARSKFAAFMKTNPPAPVTAPPSSAPTPAKNLSAFMKAVPPTAASVGGSSVPPAPTPAPPLRSRNSSNDFAAKKAVFSPKSASKTSTFSSGPKSPIRQQKRTISGENNKLKDFMMKQPPSSIGSKPRSDSNQSNSKLAAFIATTSMAPSISSSSAPRKTSTASAPRKTSSASFKSFNPQASKQSNETSSTPAVAPAAVQTTGRPSKIPFTPRRIAPRSTGKCNYIRKRQTYFAGQNRKRSKFSLEDKRKKFMNEQLLAKEEQRRRQAAGSAGAKQNLIVQGVQCYVPDKEEVWLLSEIIEYNERTKEVTIQATLDSGESERRVVDLKDPDTIRAVAGPTATEIESLPVAILQDNPSGVEDMRLLRYLNEPSILFNLKQRFEASKPYTYTNEIVIAVNPYKWIENIYGDNLHEPYLRKPRDSLPPHVYSTSTAAYKHMTNNQMNQSILVSGESGAGKTETTKIVMNHLASVAGGKKDKTIAKVIDVNPLLESFGNAKTTRNDNSSRFGKFTQLQFSDQGKLVGAKCDTYLLEKSRVVSIAEGERNYHIFYQMLAGLSQSELQAFQLDPAFAYQYTGELKSMSIDGMDDSKWLAGTRNSLSLIGLNAADQKTLLQILAGVLHLGEISFEESGESGSRISSTQALSKVGAMFGLHTSSIEEALCNRTVITRNDAVTVPMDPVEALENRDALAKTIYSKMFDWMVQKINAAISAEESQIHGQIGVLDIFGFEDFAQNGFEQFCINYANEKLQQKFTTDVFKTVEDEYVREGLQWDHIQYQDNKDIVEVIDGKLGIIALMNDHLRQARGTEEALVNKIKTNHQKKGNEINPHIDFPRVKRTQFIINHYAGSVTYETVGFMEKHRDMLQKDLMDLIQSSDISLLTELFEEKECVVESAGNRSKAGVKSLGSQFKISLGQLMENISVTNTHYIRCIKPNSNKSPTEFNKRMVVEQLRSAGVIEAIRITRSGYPSRLTPEELATRYAIMFPPSMHTPDFRRTSTIFMDLIGRKSPLEYQMGKTLIYFKNGVMEELEAMKSDFMYYEATCIQKVVLGFIERRRLFRKINAIIKIQSVMRMRLERKEYFFQRRAIVRIQRGWRKYLNTETPIEYLPPESESEEESDGGEWVDEADDSDNDEGFGDDPAAYSPTRSIGKSSRSSLKRMDELSMKAKSFMKGRSSGSTSSSSGTALEDENAMLKLENRNLRYDLELMREQCIELQSIILEINKSRKR